MIRCALCDAPFPARDGYPMAYAVGPLMACEPCAQGLNGAAIPEHVAKAAGFASAAAMAQEMRQQQRARVADEHCQRILDALSQRTQCTVTELCELTGLERGRVHSMISRLRKREAPIGSAYAGRHSVYWRSDRPAPALKTSGAQHYVRQAARHNRPPNNPTPPNVA